MDNNVAIMNFYQFLRNNNLDGEDVTVSYLFTAIHNLLENNRNMGTQVITGKRINCFERDYSILKNAADADEPVAQFVLGIYLWNQGGERCRMCDGVRYIRKAASNGYKYASMWLENDKTFLNLKDSGYDVQL